MNKDFIFQGSRFEKDWRFFLEQSARWTSFKTALNLLEQFKIHDEVHILETGCVRQWDDIGSGYSTVIFADYLTKCSSKDRGSLTSVDNCEEHIAAAKIILKDLGYLNECNIHFVLKDSREVLKEYITYRDITFDLIYLDSYDADPLNEVQTNKSQYHQYYEVLAADKLLSRHGILLLDDNDLGTEFGGKTKLSKDWLIKNPEYTLLIDEYQSLWVKLL